jgi:hypothetical protein
MRSLPLPKMPLPWPLKLLPQQKLMLLPRPALP